MRCSSEFGRSSDAGAVMVQGNGTLKNGFLGASSAAEVSDAMDKEETIPAI